MAQAKSLILIVDDELDILRLLQRTLEPAGYKVITASDGNQALALVSEKLPEVVLLDIKMPGKSGIEILKELREHHPDIAIIMATGISDVNTAVEAMRLGAYDYLVKPFNVDLIFLSVERALEKRRLLLENRNYQLNLEKRVTEQTQLLEQKVRELTALNNLFVKYLNQGFEAAEAYGHLANSIIKAGEDIRVLAKEAEARRVEVHNSPAEKGEAS